MPDKSILSAVESAEKDFREAEKKFDKEAEALKEKASRPHISLALSAEEEMYSLQKQLNDNAKIVREFADITADYWAACEALILSLDAICRPLLKENPSAKTIGIVSRFISKIIEDVSNLEIDFSVSLNSTNLGDVGSFNPKSSVVTQTIERLWKEAYKSHPDYAKDAKRIKDEEDAKERRIRENRKASKDRVNQVIAREKELISAAKSVNEKREIVIDEGNKRISDFEQKLLSEASRLKTLLIDTEKERLQSELENAKQELKATGFFDFSNKKVLKAKISSFNKFLKKPAISPNIAQQLNDIDKIAYDNSKQYEDAVNAHISARFVLAETRRDFGEPSANDEEGYRKMIDILNFLASKKTPQKIDDIIEGAGFETGERCKYYLRELRSQDFLVRSEKDWETYFAISPDIQVTMVECWEEKSKEAKKGIPCPPADVQELFK